MAEKTTILAFGDSPVVLRALERYAGLAPAMRERYELLGVCGYDAPVPADVYGAAEIVMFGLYRRYGMRRRAEGIPALEFRLSRGKRGLLFDFGNFQLVSHPLVWVVPGGIPLAAKLDDLLRTDHPARELEPLREMFRKEIFPIDGHRK